MMLLTPCIYIGLLAFLICEKNVHAVNVFDVVPKSQDVYEGRSAILQCSLKQAFKNDYSLSWLVDGKRVTNGRRYMGPDGYLHLDSVSRDMDSGRFQCVATNNENPNERSITDAVSLNIKWLDVSGVLVRLPSGGTDILPGSRVMLKCNVTGRPKPQTKHIIWMLNGTNLENYEAQFDFSKGKLVIEKTALKIYDGSYSCCLPEEGKNKCSSRNYDLHVRDKSVPVIIQRPTDIVVRHSGDATFTCIFDAFPSARIEWSRDGYSIKPKQTSDCRMCATGKNETLRIKNVKDRHQGTYKCEATGSKGNTASAEAKLTIAYIRDFSNPGTELEYLIRGQDIEKVCNPPEAEPHPTIVWMRNGREILPSTRGTGGEVTVSGKTLVIQSVQPSDEGEYQCIARNMAGNQTKTYTFKIVVEPKIRSGLVGRTEREGSDVTLKCLADAVPPPTYIWHQNNTVLKKNNHFIITENQLIIKSILNKDAAEYKCTASNGYGAATSSAFIRIEEWIKFDPMPSDLCVEAHMRTEIPCVARGVKNPTVSWTVSPAGNNTRIITNGSANKTLVLTDPMTGEHWTAYCSASISGALDGTPPPLHTVEISVGKRPRIIKPPVDSLIFEGQSVRLDCGINPEVEISLQQLRWKILTNRSAVEYTVKNNSDSNDYNVMNNGSFYIKNASTADSGTYACHYKDCGFEVREQAVLDVAVREGPIATPGVPEDEDPAGTGPQYKKIQTVALAAGCSVAYLIVTITIIVYCRKKRQKKNKSDGEIGEEDQPMLNGFSKKDNGVTGKYEQIMLEPVTHLSEDIEDLQYDPSKLVHVTAIGRGEFGEVFLSRAPGIFPDLADDVLVMVKKLEYQSDEDEGRGSDAESKESETKKSLRYEFNREIRLLFTASHENIGKILGVCSKDTDSPTKPDYFITEYLEWGILKLCLQASNEGKLQRFNKNVKMKMCYQISAGLEHLTKLGLCHQDVATRNCLISSKLLIKLSVLSLKKEGFENEYAHHKGRMMPIRWMAPEALNEGSYKLKSDVWSFGVTCWEIFTLGTLPFSDLSDEHFLEEMQGEQPPTLPLLDGSKRMTSLISKCCQKNPRARPEFCQITKKLQSILGIDPAPEDKTAVETDTDTHRPQTHSGGGDVDSTIDVDHEVKT